MIWRAILFWLLSASLALADLPKAATATLGAVTNKIQTLTWDAFDRLIEITDRDTNNSGFNFVSVFDGLGRRVRTLQTAVTNGVAITNPPAVSTVDSWYDPQVEFLEAGVNANGAFTAKAYGPDASGTYGGMQGVGGLETLYTTGLSVGIGSVQDYFGNILATISNSVVTWTSNRYSSYGPTPGYQPLALSLDTTIAQTVGWRGLRIDPTGDYHIGARRYDPVAGRFLSADPLGHSASMDLFSFCGGDPVNQFDPDGRLAKTGVDFLGNTIVGGANVVDPIPAQLRASVPDPNTWAGYYGRQFGADLGLGYSFYQMFSGIMNIGAGGGMITGGGASEVFSLGGSSVFSIPVTVAGGGAVVVGGAQVAWGVVGLNNFWNINTAHPSSGDSGGGGSSSSPDVGTGQGQPPEGESPQFIFRTGSQTDNALTDPAGVSFRDSISSSADQAQVFKPGVNIYAVDVNQLPPGSVIFDGGINGMPAGHVSVMATPQEIQAAIVPQGPANPLNDFGLNPMENGSSYKLPK